MTLFLTSCGSDAIIGINLLDLPWKELSLKNFIQYPIILSILYLPAGLIINYTELFRTKWAGKKIMKLKLKYPNFPFWFVILMLMGLVWFYLTGVNNDIQLYMASDLPNEIIEGIILMMLLRKTAILVTLLHFGFLLLLRLSRQPEIREKGIIQGLLFHPWKQMISAEWREPGRIKINYRWAPRPHYLFFWKRNEKLAEKESEFCLEIKPEQEAEVNYHLQKFIPDRIISK
jgi:hypothetical protein